jgi:hypothetical protein
MYIIRSKFFIRYFYINKYIVFFSFFVHSSNTIFLPTFPGIIAPRFEDPGENEFTLLLLLFLPFPLPNFPLKLPRILLLRSLRPALPNICIIEEKTHYDIQTIAPKIVTISKQCKQK